MCMDLEVMRELERRKREFVEAQESYDNRED